MNKHNLAKMYELEYFKRKKVLTKRRQKKVFHLYKESLLKRFPKLYKHNKDIYDDIQDLEKKWKKGLDAFKYPARKRRRNARLAELWEDCGSTSYYSESSDDVSFETEIRTPQDVSNSIKNLTKDEIDSDPIGQHIHLSDACRFAECSPTTSSIFESNIEQQDLVSKDKIKFELGSEEVVESPQTSSEGYENFLNGSGMYTSTQQN